MTATAHEAGQIGPNAALQVIAALAPGERAEIFAAAGCADWLDRPPTAMIDERRAARLHRSVRALLPVGRGEAVLAEAGRRTADYLLANRIPAPVRHLLRPLPAGWAAPLLATAIGRHAWTFAGTGRFTWRAGPPLRFILEGNPLGGAGNGCSWHRAVFERLFQALVAPACRVAETACGGKGDPACVFQIDWRLTAADRR